MPPPGSSHALVLPTLSGSDPDETPPIGERIAAMLRPFIDATEYTAIAVVHGMGARAPRAFDLAKQRWATGRGVAWVTDPDVIDALTGPDADVLRELFAPASGKLMRFFSVNSRTITGELKWFRVNSGEIDEKYLEAGLG